jgi:hypothetical protein
VSSRTVLLDLLTAVALLWMTLSDSWLSIAVTGALVLLRVTPRSAGRAARG